jgi:hypothetical protein
MNLMARQDFGNKKGSSYSFDTLSSNSSATAFEVRRESDNVTQMFTYVQLLDGTYNTFLGGGNGAIKNWYGNGLTLNQNNTTLQPRLTYNSGNPYVNGYDYVKSLFTSHNINLSMDWIVSIIVGEESNANNENCNFFITNSSNVVFAFSITSASGFANIQLNRPIGNISTQGQFTLPNTGFKLLTFKYVAGVLTIYLNNSIVTLSAGSNVYTVRVISSGNTLGLNDRGDTSGGRINQYKHLGVIAGKLSSFDVSTYNLSIMTKYGI